MDLFIELLKSVGGPALALLVAMALAIKWFERRENKCAETVRELHEKHTKYVEEQQKIVTAALLDNTHSNREIAQSTRELTQTLSGKHPTLPPPTR